MLKVPTINQAELYLEEASKLNPGGWVGHSRNAAKAAQYIAAELDGLDSNLAYSLGLLHDIGRREGPSGMLHMVRGYNYLRKQGFSDGARICLTHTYPLKDISATYCRIDCSTEEYSFLSDFLASVEYNAYDELIQLCDCLAMAEGFCLLEKRMVDVAIRHGTIDQMVDKWKAFFAIKQKIESKIKRSIYCLLPGVIDATFGWHNQDS